MPVRRWHFTQTGCPSNDVETGGWKQGRKLKSFRSSVNSTLNWGLLISCVCFQFGAKKGKFRGKSILFPESQKVDEVIRRKLFSKIPEASRQHPDQLTPLRLTQIFVVGLLSIRFGNFYFFVSSARKSVLWIIKNDVIKVSFLEISKFFQVSSKHSCFYV